MNSFLHCLISILHLFVFIYLYLFFTAHTNVLTDPDMVVQKELESELITHSEISIIDFLFFFILIIINSH